jgi:hypothetical protein
MRELHAGMQRRGHACHATTERWIWRRSAKAVRCTADDHVSGEDDDVDGKGGSSAESAASRGGAGSGPGGGGGSLWEPPAPILAAASNSRTSSNKAVANDAVSGAAAPLPQAEQMQFTG